MNKTLYEYFLRDNINIWKALFIEKQRGNMEKVNELLIELNNNTREIELLKSEEVEEYGV